MAAEFGIVTLRQTRIRAIAKTQGLRGRMLAKVHGQLDAYLSACQLGITLASLGLGWIGEPAFAGLLEPLLALRRDLARGDPRRLVRVRLHRDFLPAYRGRRAGAQIAGDPQSGAVGLWTAPPLYGFYWTMYPAICLLNTSANAVLRLAGLSGKGGHDAHYSTDELKLILRTSQPGRIHPRRAQHPGPVAGLRRSRVSDLMRPIHE